MDVVSRQHVWSVALGKLILKAREQVENLPMEWTEPVKVHRRTYHLIVTRDPQAGGYVVQCKELPGALEQGETAEAAIESGRDAIESVLSVIQRRHGVSRVRGVKTG